MTFAPPETQTPVATWSAVLFDLDGTLVDSGHDITAALATTFAEFGIPIPDAAGLRAYVGPPLLDSLMRMAGLNEPDAWKVLTRYREIYGAAALKSPVFPGVLGVLKRLHDARVPVALATSKPEALAEAILRHRDLLPYFTVVTGASEDETLSKKADIVAEAMRRLRARGIDPTDAVMIGDRAYDTDGARANGLPTVLVEWGYGSPAEAREAYAVVHSVEQLARILKV
ncbi:MAG TPA: HAD hydrolase-like protein [Candidatus Lumbricidophila sp.]|nr:HAD hydrolase-like protein [Candidatus Lumbricidophila sp.]